MEGRVKVHVGVMAGSKLDALTREAGESSEKDPCFFRRGALNRCRDASGKHTPPHPAWAHLADPRNPNFLAGQMGPFCGEGSMGHRKWEEEKASVNLRVAHAVF